MKFCTFSPQTNRRELIFNESSKSVYKRLYDDHSRRKYNSLINVKKQDNKYDSLANKKHLKNLDKKRIEKLYNDHKQNKLNQSKLKKTIDEETGLVFKPELFHNEKFQPQNNFYERNEILLNKKNIFSDWYIKLMKENSYPKAKIYSKEEAEKIKDNLVDRLYNKDIDKFKIKNSTITNEENEKFDYKKNLRNNEKEIINFTKKNNTHIRKLNQTNILKLYEEEKIKNFENKKNENNFKTISLTDNKTKNIDENINPKSIENDSVITEIEQNHNSSIITNKHFINDFNSHSGESNNNLLSYHKKNTDDKIRRFDKNLMNYNKNKNIQAQNNKNENISGDEKNYILDQLSLASPQNFLSTKSSTNYYFCQKSENNSSFSNIDQDKKKY